MVEFLGLIIMSCFITGLLFVPFIDLLYKVKLQRQHQKTRDILNKRTLIFDRFHSWKAGTPFGGGILIIAVTTLVTLWAYGIFNIGIKPWELFVLLFSFLGFGALGLYDDIKKLINGRKNDFFGLKLQHKFIIQWILALILGTVLYTQLGYNFIFIKYLGASDIGILFIPFSAFVIVSFVNAFNISDGLDGLASGLFLICMISFLVITAGLLNESLGVFIAVLIGSVAAFLYFNIFPARLWLGDVGSLSLGATLAVVGLLTGKVVALAFIGGVFVIEVGSSLIQILSKRFLHRKLLPVTPFHLYLQKIGWQEPKIVMRLWLLGFFFAIIGLFVAGIK